MNLAKFAPAAQTLGVPAIQTKRQLNLMGCRMEKMSGPYGVIRRAFFMERAMSLTPTDWGTLDQESISAIRHAIAQGIADGIREAITDRDLMRGVIDQAITVAREEVATTSGRWLWSGLAGLLSRTAWWLLIAAGILTLGGGWSGVLAFFKGATVK